MSEQEQFFRLLTHMLMALGIGAGIGMLLVIGVCLWAVLA